MIIRPPHRLATIYDATDLVALVSQASLGMAEIIWSSLAQRGESAYTVALRMARAEDTSMSYRSAIVTDWGAGVMATMIGHRLPDQPQPIDPSVHHPVAVPWLELRNESCGYWHLATLAVYPEHRGMGLGSALLHFVEPLQEISHAKGVCLHVADRNLGARRLYERFGFRQTASRPMAKGNWINPGKEWLLYSR